MGTNQFESIFQNTVVTRLWHETPPEAHVAVIIGLALLAHVSVKSIRHVSEWFIVRSHVKKSPFIFVTQQPKFITLTRASPVTYRGMNTARGT
jgi:hypothetical protein